MGTYKTKKELIQEIEKQKHAEWRKERLEWLYEYPENVIRFLGEMKIVDAYYYSRTPGIKFSETERLQRCIFIKVSYQNKMFSIADVYRSSGERVGNYIYINPFINKKNNIIEGEPIDSVLPGVNIDTLHDFIFYISGLGEIIVNECTVFQGRYYKRLIEKINPKSHEERLQVRSEIRKRDFFRHIQKV